MIDPQIPLGVQPAVPFNPIQGLQGIEALESARALAAQRQALADERQAQAQARVQDAADTAAINTAVQGAKGYIPDAIDALNQGGQARAAGKLQTQWDTHRKNSADAANIQNKADLAALDYGSRLVNQITDQASYDAMKPRLVSLVPALANVLGTTYDPAVIDRVKQIGQTQQQISQAQQEGMKLIGSGDIQKGWGTILGALPDDQSRQKAVLEGVASGHLPKELASVYQDAINRHAPASFYTVQTGMTPTEQASVTGLVPGTQQPTEAAKAHQQTAANEAQTRAQEAERIGLERQRLALTGPGGTADPDQVAAWVRDLRDPTSKTTIQQVPQALRTAVEEQLQPGERAKLTAQSQSMKEMAQSLLPNIAKVEDLARQMQSAGLTGSSGGRLARWASGESAAADLEGLTDAQKTLVGKFVTEAGLLKSGVARAHGGARGGGSIAMLKSLDPLLDPGTKDLQTYLGNLAGAKDFIDGYAHMGEKEPSGNAKDPMNIRKGGG